MIFKRLAENWRETTESDLRRSVKPFFKGDHFCFSSFRSGAETYLQIVHGEIILEFRLEAGQLAVEINGFEAEKSPLLPEEARKELSDILSSKGLAESERNRRVAILVRESLNKLV